MIKDAPPPSSIKHAPTFLFLLLAVKISTCTLSDMKVVRLTLIWRASLGFSGLAYIRDAL